MNRPWRWVTWRRLGVIACVVCAVGSAVAWRHSKSAAYFGIGSLGDPRLVNTRYCVDAFGTYFALGLNVRWRMGEARPQEDFDETPQTLTFVYPPPRPPPPDKSWSFPGGRVNMYKRPGEVSVVMHVRYWLPIILSAVYPTVVVLKLRRESAHRRRRLGLCVACGYNLTGNVTGACPECGCAVSR
jgi:hypothetical protein